MEAKERAAREALALVMNGQTIGLGSGSTAEIFIRLLGERAVKEKLAVKCVATSLASEEIARECKLRVVALGDVEKVDLAVDGADQVDAHLNLIKGYGGALLREKIVDYGATRFAVIVDESKMREVLSGRVPLEVLPFACGSVKRSLGKLGVRSSLRKKGSSIFSTDNGNLILDAEFESIDRPGEVESLLKNIPGVMEVGIFTKNVEEVIVGCADKVLILKD